MTGLFGFLASCPDLGASVLSADAGPVQVRVSGEALQWGVGYFQGDDILLRRRPADPRPVVPVGQMLADVRTQQLIGCYGSARSNAMRADDTHPFRYRTWLFAHTGTIDDSPKARAKMLSLVPEFLQSSLRGETVGELLFHVFLANLHAQGRLHTDSASPHEARTALRGLVDGVERIAAEMGATKPELNVMVANGQFIVVARTGRGVLYRDVHSRELAELFDDDPSLRRGATRPGSRVSVVASHVVRNSSAYRAMPGRSLLTLTHDAEPMCEPIEPRLARRVPFAA